jgi:hypothetical protein
MLLMGYLPDCCEQCCDCEKPDPTKDKVRVEMPAAVDKMGYAQDPSVLLGHMARQEPFKPHADIDKPVDQAKRGELDNSAGIPWQDVALRERHAEQARIRAPQAEDAQARKRHAEEAEAAKGAQEIAEALEVQEAIEAQDLLEAQQASLCEHETMLRKEREVEDAKRYEEERAMEQSMKELRQKEEREDQLKVDAFLKANGFKDIDSKRTSLFKSFHPLHTGVSQNNAEMVQLLLAAGARPLLKNSAGLSPLQLAQKLNKKESHAKVVKLLQFGL